MWKKGGNKKGGGKREGREGERYLADMRVPDLFCDPDTDRLHHFSGGDNYACRHDWNRQLVSAVVFSIEEESRMSSGGIERCRWR